MHPEFLAVQNFNYLKLCLTTPTHNFNPLSPQDALQHKKTPLKTDLIFLQLRALE